ncbi:MAG: hypothetical protein NUV51_03545 [Sulfuricaulis sp.]|nr:hypothetical protein [Sulfuricaulis sp.]
MTPTKTELLERIRALETDRRLLLEVASPQGRAVIRAAMRVAKLWNAPIGYAPYMRALGALVRACVRLERKQEKANGK